MFNYRRYSLQSLLFVILYFPSNLDTSIYGNNVISLDKFGVITPRIELMTLCKGTKRHNCSLNSLKTDKEFGKVEFRFEIQKDVQMNKVKLTMHLVEKNVPNATPDVLKWVDRPCDHFLFAPLMQKYFKTDPKCIIKKGIYAFSLNTTALFYDLFGLKFFYGTYRGQCTVMSKDCNIMCVSNQFKLQKQNATLKELD